jgi:GNAT superfamily N-acetyltransferase
MKLQILYLQNNSPKEAKECINKIIWDEWGRHYTSKQDLESEIEQSFKKESVSRVFYIIDRNGEIYGTASFLESDLDLFPEINSWLANFYILEKYRKQGIGKKLYKEIIEYARSLGYEYLYLYTTDTSYYSTKRWNIIKNFPYKNKENFLMQLKLEDEERIS